MIDQAMLLTDAGFWAATQDGDPLAARIYRQHYSAYAYADGRRDDPTYRNRNLIIGPGEKMLLIGPRHTVWGWRKFIDASGQQGVNNCIFAKPVAGPIDGLLASEMIRQADAIAFRRWPGERHYTYVDPDHSSSNPGYCYLMAGWRRWGKTKGGLIVLERLPEKTPAVWTGVAIEARSTAGGLSAADEGGAVA